MIIKYNLFQKILYINRILNKKFHNKIQKKCDNVKF